MICMMHEFTDIGLRSGLASCFNPLPKIIEPADALNQETLYKAFHRVFRCNEAKAERDVVFVWAVDKPYMHAQGKTFPSQFVYIEKTKGTMCSRWTNENLRRVTTDYDEGAIEGDPTSLRSCADANMNLTFYSRLIREHGSLSIWWASSAILNKSAGLSSHNSEAWEGHLLALYMHKHGCRPLKNRKGGFLLQEVQLGDNDLSPKNGG